jgi:hypothetical protein
MQKKILVDFHVIDQQLIRFSTFGRYWRKHQLFIDYNKAYGSVRREVFYNILIEFGIPRQAVGLIKMCLNATCSTE